MEIHPEKPGGAPRPEPEIARPEIEDALCEGRDPGFISSSPTVDSSGETVETPLGPPFPDRQKPETVFISRPSPLYMQTTETPTSPVPQNKSFTNPMAPTKFFSYILLAGN